MIKGPLQRAVEAAGGEAEFRQLLGIGSRTFAYWKAGKRLTLERILDIEAATGIPRHELRPDIWSAPTCP